MSVNPYTCTGSFLRAAVWIGTYALWIWGVVLLHLRGFTPFWLTTLLVTTPLLLWLMLALIPFGILGLFLLALAKAKALEHIGLHRVSKKTNWVGRFGAIGLG